MSFNKPVILDLSFKRDKDLTTRNDTDYEAPRNSYKDASGGNKGQGSRKAKRTTSQTGGRK